MRSRPQLPAHGRFLVTARHRSVACIGAVVLLAGCAGGSPSSVPSGPRATGASPASSNAPDAPPPTNKPSSSPVVAIGDSYASGVGAGSATGPCGRSALGWTSLVAQELGRPLINLACGGAVLSEVRTQIGSIPADTELVLVSAGANDAGAPALMRGCRPGQPCEQAGRDFQSRIPAMGRELEEILRSVDAPGRRIVLASYPLGADSTCDQLDKARLAVLLAVSSELHAELGAVVERLRRDGAAVEFAGPELFAGHDVCSADPWMHGPWSLLYMHPTAQGHRAIADEVLTKLKAD